MITVRRRWHSARPSHRGRMVLRDSTVDGGGFISARFDALPLELADLRGTANFSFVLIGALEQSGLWNAGDTKINLDGSNLCWGDSENGRMVTD